jgi:hypothetical protein
VLLELLILAVAVAALVTMEQVAVQVVMAVQVLLLSDTQHKEKANEKRKIYAVIQL